MTTAMEIGMAMTMTMAIFLKAIFKFGAREKPAMTMAVASGMAVIMTMTMVMALISWLGG